jgi:hypothetical protein
MTVPPFKGSRTEALMLRLLELGCFLPRDIDDVDFTDLDQIEHCDRMRQRCAKAAVAASFAHYDRIRRRAEGYCYSCSAGNRSLSRTKGAAHARRCGVDAVAGAAQAFAVSMRSYRLPE